MRPADVLAIADERLWSTSAKGWIYGVDRLTARLGMRREDVSAAMSHHSTREGWVFARVAQAANHPRCFELVEAGGVPALLVPVFGDELSRHEDGPGDVIALALEGRRFWRLTLSCDGLGLDADAEQGGVLRLYQDAHGYIRQALRVRARDGRAQLAETRAKQSAIARHVEPIKAIAVLDGRGPLNGDHPCWPDYAAAMLKVMAAGDEALARVRSGDPVAHTRGALILDPGAFDWTQRGVLRDVDTIQILDAPATGDLGRALRRINPLIGTTRGVELIGELATDQKKRAA